MNRMRIGRRWIAAGVVLMLAAATAVVAADAPLLGIWMTEPRDGLVQISVGANGIIEGRIVGGRDRLRKDEKNPDPARREQLLRGR